MKRLSLSKIFCFIGDIYNSSATDIGLSHLLSIRFDFDQDRSMVDDLLDFIQELFMVLFNLVRNLFAVAGLIFIMLNGSKYISNHTAGEDETLSPSEGGVIFRVSSPDGRFKVVVVNENGGGGIAPYCFDSVYVASAGVSDEKARNDDDRVLVGSCGVLGRQRTGSIRWISADKIEIAIDATVGARNVRSMQLKGTAMRGQVTLVYMPAD